MGNQQSGAPGGAGGTSATPHEPLECVVREVQRDEHLKNLGFKRNKSIRRSIAKKLKKRDKKKDELDSGSQVEEVTATDQGENKQNENSRRNKDTLAKQSEHSKKIKDTLNKQNEIHKKNKDPPSTTTATDIVVETRTSIGSKVDGGMKVEVIKVDEKKVAGPLVGEAQPLPAHLQNNPARKVDKLRRSIRRSMKKKKETVGDGLSKTQQWQIDEAAVRSSTCQFYVKYLGCCEVFESRGMQVCEAAVKTLKTQRRRTVRGILYVSGDSLKVVDEDTKGLVLDQTIEKVSFCAPDRNFDRGFSYICRDGTTRRWMCHAMMAIGDSGERLSHAVGCAFGICLERKQKREKVSVTMNYNSNDSSFTRVGSFRVGTMTERLQDPQAMKPSADPVPLQSADRAETVHAIDRPRPSELMYQRQASFRGLGQLSGNSPFKRGGKGQLSLRLNELPSTRERRDGSAGNLCDSPILEDMELPMSNLESDTGSSVSAVCRQLTRGMDLLMPEDPFSLASDVAASGTSGASSPCLESRCSTTSLSPLTILQPLKLHQVPETPDLESDYNPWDNVPDQPQSPRLSSPVSAATFPHVSSPAQISIPAYLSLTQPTANSLTIPAYLTVGNPPPQGGVTMAHPSLQPSHGNLNLYSSPPDSRMSGGPPSLADDWLKNMDPTKGKVFVNDHHKEESMGQQQNGTSTGWNSPSSSNSTTSAQNNADMWLQSAGNSLMENHKNSSIMEDPFDAEWADVAARNTINMNRNSVDFDRKASVTSINSQTNPFTQDSTAFELQL